ncbi:MAG: IS21 family transposase [Clostridia bacterium]|nr:IS21 family transposase [Clostridia bacterium]
MMVITTDLYLRMRQMFEDGMSEREIARILGVSRQTVHKYASGDNIPGSEGRKPSTRTASVLTDEVKAYIDNLLEFNKTCHRKQKRTARKIFELLQKDLKFEGCETTVRKYVAEQKVNVRKPSVPLVFSPGEDMQVDWGEAYVWLAGEKTKVYLFIATLSYSGAVFVKAYMKQTTECFIDGLISAFKFFKGVTKRVTCDNGAMAVASGSGKDAVPVERYAKFAALYAFDMVFCNARSGNEKGRVEAYVGYVRRNWLDGKPEFVSLSDLNYDLEMLSDANMYRKQTGKATEIIDLFEEEVPFLRRIPKYDFDFSHKTETKVSNYCSVKFESNTYSVPYEYCGKKVTLKATPDEIQIIYKGEVIALHERCYSKNKAVFDIFHYVGLLKAKKRAILNAKPIWDYFPHTFIAWLEEQKLTAQELYETVERAIDFGYEVVMRKDIAPSEAPEITPKNEVPVIETELSPYDNLIPSSTKEGKNGPH